MTHSVGLWKVRLNRGMEPAPNKPWFAISRSGSTIHASIRDHIGNGATASEFRETLAQHGDAKTTELTIDSEGGSVMAARHTVRALNDHPSTVNGLIVGLAGSAASYVAVAGTDTLKIDHESWIFVHEPFAVGVINASRADGQAKQFKELADQYARAYATKSGESVDHWRQVMANGGRWFSAMDALSAGLVDDVVYGTGAVASIRPYRGEIFDVTNPPAAVRALYTTTEADMPDTPKAETPAETKPEASGGEVKPTATPPDTTTETPTAVAQAPPVATLPAEIQAAIKPQIEAMASQFKATTKALTEQFRADLALAKAEAGYTAKIEALVRDGRISPAEKDVTLDVVADLSEEKRGKYLAALEQRPAIVAELSNEYEIETEDGERHSVTLDLQAYTPPNSPNARINPDQARIVATAKASAAKRAKAEGGKADDYYHEELRKVAGVK